MAEHSVLLLERGRFDGGAQSELAAWLDSRAARGPCFVAHIHGGLVDRAAALSKADRLAPIYAGAGGCPLFVVWQSGLLETLQQQPERVFADVGVRTLRDRLIRWVWGYLEDLDAVTGTRAAGAVPAKGQPTLDKELDSAEQAGREPLAELDLPVPTEEPDAAEIDDLRRFLEDDPELAALDSRLSAPEQGPARARGLITGWLVKGGIKIGLRTLDRWRNNRDHGVYTTVVEEIIRELPLAGYTAQAIWDAMKGSTAQAFAGPAEQHGGTALIEALSTRWAAGDRPRILLVGHSAGAVFIGNLLEAAGHLLPETIRLEVVLLAPAVSYADFARALTAAGPRVAAFRCFGLEDTLESNDPLLPNAPLLYPRSLLYFVSGLCERDEVDRPLLGMERFFPGRGAFNAAERPEFRDVLDRLGNEAGRWLWAPAGPAPGLTCRARSHAGFDAEEGTLDSLRHIVAQGC